MSILLGLDRERNPRGIQFGEWASGNSNGIVNAVGSPFDGSFVDSWGLPYMISIDGDGDGQIQDPANPENSLTQLSRFAGVVIFFFLKIRESQGVRQLA
ncbi:MAG: hypothetical protein R3F19_08850 [Verrucomicrobiales bacterium]